MELAVHAGYFLVTYLIDNNLSGLSNLSGNGEARVGGGELYADGHLRPAGPVRACRRPISLPA